MPVIDTFAAGLLALIALAALARTPVQRPVPVRVKRKPNAR